jgi:TRAP-type C4-dicarboxylate transport system substrate-binding protein
VIDLYPNSELGSETSTMEGARNGSVDLCVVGGANAASLFPQFQILSVPYIFKDFDTFRKAFTPDGTVWQELVKIVSDANTGVQLCSVQHGIPLLVIPKAKLKTPTI